PGGGSGKDRSSQPHGARRSVAADGSAAERTGTGGMNTVALHPQGATDSAGPASRRIIVGYGFWLFLLSDIIMFSAFFATYAVLSGATDGGPTAAQLFDSRNVAVETACLLASSFACGMASLAVG